MCLHAFVIHSHISCCTACCKSSGEHLDSTACTCMQDNGYNPHDDDGRESDMAYKLGLPRDLRGPADATEFHGQKKRKNTGKCANRGGFGERVKRIEEISKELPDDLRWKLDVTNRQGASTHAACAFMCVRSSSTSCVDHRVSFVRAL